MNDQPTSLPDDLSLDVRGGLPDDLTFLLTKIPRDSWETHQNLGEMSKFWLARHDMFRELSAAMEQSIEILHDKGIEPKEFQDWFMPRLWFFLGQLDSHHNVEDSHYFPLLRRAEAKLNRGFDLLDQDHLAVHQGLMDLQEAGQKLDQSFANDSARILTASGDMAKILKEFDIGLNRHLLDEEDIVMPLFLDRGERNLGA